MLERLRRRLGQEPDGRPRSGADITDPRYREIALEMTSTAENSTLDWSSAYSYIEDIDDDRGYTGGLVGFTTGTGDMLTLLLRYRELEPANVLTPYIPLLRRVLDADEGSRTRLAHQLLDPGFVPAWQRAAADPLFRRAQREERERVYWAPALVEAQRDQVGPLGLAIYYDVSVNHGPGEDADSFGGILAAARGTTPPPADGGEETAFLRAVVDRRVRVLEGWGDYQRHGRQEMHHELLDAGNLELVPPIRWSVYGDSFELPDYPRPRD